MIKKTKKNKNLNSKNISKKSKKIVRKTSKNKNVIIVFRMFDLLLNKSEEYNDICHKKGIQSDGLNFWRSVKPLLDDKIEILTWNKKNFNLEEQKYFKNLEKDQEKFEIIHFLYQIFNIPFIESTTKPTNNLRKLLQVGLNIGQLEHHFKRKKEYTSNKIINNNLKWYGKRRNKILKINNFIQKIHLKNISNMDNLDKLYNLLLKTLNDFIKNIK